MDVNSGLFGEFLYLGFHPAPLISLIGVSGNCNRLTPHTTPGVNTNADKRIESAIKARPTPAFGPDFPEPSSITCCLIISSGLTHCSTWMRLFRIQNSCQLRRGNVARRKLTKIAFWKVLRRIGLAGPAWGSSLHGHNSRWSLRRAVY